MIAASVGSVLSNATRGTVVAFEAEGPNGWPEPAWSDLVNGVADYCDTSRRVAPPMLWAGDRPSPLLAITTEHVSGRSHIAPTGTFGSGPGMTFGRTIGR